MICHMRARESAVNLLFILLSSNLAATQQLDVRDPNGKCSALLIGDGLFDLELMADLKALSIRERATTHVPALEPYLRRVGQLGEKYLHGAQLRWIADQLIE